MVEVDGSSGTSGMIPPGKRGVWGDSDTGFGVVGTSKESWGVFGYGAAGVQASGDFLGMNAQGSDTAILAAGYNGTGVGATGGNTGVSATGGEVGVYGTSSAGAGVSGSSEHSYGILGTSDNFVGIQANSSNSYGLAAAAGNVPIYAHNTVYGGVSGGNDAYLAAPEYAGDFHGDVRVLGALHKPGGGFKIDHPIHPADMYLLHSFVESDDMKNIYDGVVTLDSNGKSQIQLPEWFETLNKDFRYQLTAIGSPGPNLYIEQEISNNCFMISGGKPGMKVSWLVTGIRKDAWAESHRIRTEVEKPAKECGYYLHPEIYNKSPEKNVVMVNYPEHKRFGVDRLKEIKVREEKMKNEIRMEE